MQGADGRRICKVNTIAKRIRCACIHTTLEASVEPLNRLGEFTVDCKPTENSIAVQKGA